MIWCAPAHRAIFLQQRALSMHFDAPTYVGETALCVAGFSCSMSLEYAPSRPGSTVASFASDRLCCVPSPAISQAGITAVMKVTLPLRLLLLWSKLIC